MRRLLLLLALPALLLTASPAGAADPGRFRSPSGNISCELQGARLRCDIGTLGATRPPRPSRCLGDWGHAFSITRAGSKGRRICITDSVGGPGARTVSYGDTWRRGGFTCSVRSSGVTCRNGRGHGFSLRIGRQRLF
jgi:hypothetical protein